MTPFHIPTPDEICSPRLSPADLAEMAERALKRCPDLDDGDMVFIALQRANVSPSALGGEALETAIARVKARREKLSLV